MTYNIICKKVELAESSKEKVLAKVKKLSKFFADDAECRIVVSAQREQMVVEITFPYKGFLIRAEARDAELLSAIDVCLANIQIRKNKTKLAKRLRDSSLADYSLDLGAAPETEEDELKIIKVKHLDAKPMMAEEAILQMNMLGHNFFIFNNPDTMAANVVYKRKDGNYALIELGE